MIEIKEENLILSLKSGYKNLLSAKLKSDKDDALLIKGWCNAFESVVFKYAPEIKNDLLDMKSEIFKHIFGMLEQEEDWETPTLLKDISSIKISDKNISNEILDELSCIPYLTDLEFMKCGFAENLTSFPKLTKLKSLTISNYPLTRLPEEICDLKSLTSLRVYATKISALPQNIGNLTNLISLDFSEENCLSTLPKSITKLKKLKELSLSLNEFKIFPVEILELTQLEELDIAWYGFNNIPSDLKKLKLKFLAIDLPSNIKCIDEICSLDNITELFISGHITPATMDTICSLDKLTRLSITNSDLDHIPKKIINLKNLEMLDLSYNQISEIPVEITKLKKLRSFSIFCNSFKSLPLELAKMKDIMRMAMSQEECEF